MVNKMFNSSTIVLTSSSFIQNSESQKWGNILSAFKIRLIAKVKFVQTNKNFDRQQIKPHFYLIQRKIWRQSAHQTLQVRVPTRFYRP